MEYDDFKAFFIILFVAALFVVGPLLTIWALNTLFAFGIAYTFKTWFAVLLLVGALRGNVSTSKKD